MEDLYHILQSDPKSTREQLKQNFKQLALQHHPDKNQCTDGSFFVKLNNAWEILGNEEMRHEYDVRWRERCTVQDLPIQEEVEFSEFYAEDCEGEEVYKYQCRCGGDFTVTETDAKLRFDIICCETCSLTIKVLYCDLSYDEHSTNSVNSTLRTDPAT